MAVEISHEGKGYETIYTVYNESDACTSVQSLPALCRFTLPSWHKNDDDTQGNIGAGEEEMVSLTTEKVKWLLPPGVRGTADSSDEDSEDSEEDSSEEEEEERPRRRSSRRRGRARAGPGKRRVGRRPQRSPSYEPSVRCRNRFFAGFCSLLKGQACARGACFWSTGACKIAIVMWAQNLPRSVVNEIFMSQS